MNPVQDQPELLYSTLAGDPELGELVDLFITEIPDRVAQMQACVDRQDWPELGRIAHQLKGAAGSYGFPQLTPLLDRVDKQIKHGAGPQEARAAFDAVVDGCERVRAGVPA